MHTIEYLERNANTCTNILHFKQRMGKAQLHETGDGDSRIFISQTCKTILSAHIKDMSFQCANIKKHQCEYNFVYVCTSVISFSSLWNDSGEKFNAQTNLLQESCCVMSKFCQENP